MPHCAAAMSEGPDDVKSAPPILTSRASARDNNSFNSACTAESTEELQARLAEIAKCAPVAPSSQEPVSYNSAVTAECEQDLVARLEGLARSYPPGPMHQQLGTTSSSSQAAVEPSPACVDIINSAAAPIFQLATVMPVPVMAPVYPIQMLSPANPTSFLGYSVPASFHGSMPHCPPIDLEATMPTDFEVDRPRMVPTRKTSRSRQMKRPPIVVHDEMETTQGTSQRKQRRNTTDEATGEVSEETWQGRIKKRQDGIKNMKSSPIYYEHQDVPHKVLRFHMRPRTPDVHNRNCSKRKWEEESAKWRAAWREIDGVACLVSMSYPEKGSQKAWRKVEERLKAEEDLRRKQQDKDKKNKQAPQPEGFVKADHKQSLDRAHQKHKEQAIAILCGGA